MLFPDNYKFDIDKFYEDLVIFEWYSVIEKKIVPINDWKSYDTSQKISDALFDDIGSIIVEEDDDLEQTINPKIG